MKLNKLFGICSALLISLFSYPINTQSNHFNLIHSGECSDCLNHEHSHEYLEKIVVGNDFKSDSIYELPASIVFATSTLATEENYGEITIQANYEPEGCLSDSLWESSDSTKITVTPDELDSSKCKLICLSPFDDEVIITVKSLYFPSLTHSIKVTYDYGIVISAKVTSVTLSGKYNYNCDGSAMTLGDEYDQELLSNIFSVSDSSMVSYSVPAGSSYAGISGSYLLQKSRSSYSSGVVRCYQTNNPNNYVDVSFSTTSTTYNRSHNYSTTSYATCTRSGEQTCKNCGDVKTISALGHSYGSWGDWGDYEEYTTKEATCTSKGYTIYMRSRYRNCLRCDHVDSETDTKTEWTDALGHSYTEKEYTYSPYSASQHTKYTYNVCSRCDSRESGTSTSVKENHTISGSWAYYSTTYHRKTGTCSDCGRDSSYVQEAHIYSGAYCITCKKALTLLGGSTSGATYKCSSCNTTVSIPGDSYYNKCSGCGDFKSV